MKNPIIEIFCISWWLAIRINLDKWSLHTSNAKRSFSSGRLIFQPTQTHAFIQEQLNVLVVTGHHQAISTTS
jgi:hypothetical protein